MINEIFSNNSLQIKIPSIPKIIINDNQIFENNDNTTISKIKNANSTEWPLLYILSKGEPGYELDTGKMKIGDGHTPWAELNYIKGRPILISNDNIEYHEDTIIIKGQNEAVIGQVPAKANDGAITWITPITEDEINDLASRIHVLEENITTIGIATAQTAGLVKGSNDINQININNEGIMTINSLGIDKLENVIGTELVLNCGTAD